MNIQLRTTSRILVVCIVIAVFIIITSWVVSVLNPFYIMDAKGLHESAAFLALDFCPTNECDTLLGWGTKELPVDTSEQILQRWCVEVLYTERQTKEKGKVAPSDLTVSRKDIDRQKKSGKVVLPQTISPGGSNADQRNLSYLDSANL